MSSIVPPSGPTAHWRSLSERVNEERQRVSWTVFPHFLPHRFFQTRGTKSPPPRAATTWWTRCSPSSGAALKRSRRWLLQTRPRRRTSSAEIPLAGDSDAATMSQRGQTAGCFCLPEMLQPEGKKTTPVALDFIWGRGVRVFWRVPGCATIEPSKWTDAVF